MHFLLCTLFLYLSLHGFAHCLDEHGTQREHNHASGLPTPNNRAANNTDNDTDNSNKGSVPTSNNRADIGLEDEAKDDDDKSIEDANKTKFPDQMPEEGNHSSIRMNEVNCSCTKEITALQADLRAEMNERVSLKATVDNFVSEIHNLQKMVYMNTSKLVSAPNAIAASKKSFVAFSAKLSYNRELKPLDTVVFDTILTNDAHSYSAETGMFTTPLAGTYMFQSTVLSGYNTKVETAIIVNDKEIARIYSGAHDAHGSGSNMAIVDLRTGDTVWVRLLYQGGSHVHGYYSTFSGALLHESD